ncbi:MAG TPA: hypothetical protein VFS16_00105 [Acidimicrobiia bacterium]|nr:hypothetical protein [Acidimicrobiia bacterium]
MPWCSTCDRFLSPPSVTAEGSCPQCGRPVEAGHARPPTTATDTDPSSPPGEEEMPPVPLHMKILGASVVIYLGWRLVQGIEWVVRQFS